LSLAHLVGLGRSSEVFRHGRGHVLKLYRAPGRPPAVVTEFRAARLAHALGLPVPRAVAILESEGRTGILFERLHGGTMLDACRRRPLATLTELGRLARLQHAINACEGPSLPDQREALRLQVEGARVPGAVRRAAIAALARLPGGLRLCHGDLHPENVICAPNGPHVIDWQKATSGDPAADVARTALLLRYGRIDLGRLARRLPIDAGRAALAWFYVECRRELGGPGREEVAAWRLPLLVARLYGQPAANEAEVLAAAERLASRT
jgi:thiamine kinase